MSLSGYIDYPPLAGNELNFNPANFKSGSDFITLADADKRYFKISGGAITGSVYIGGNLDINTWSLSGTTISLTATQLNYLNVTAGSAAASKSLVLDSSSNISGIGTISLSDILITNSGTGSVSRVKYVNSTNAATWEAGIRGSTTANNPNTFYWYKTGPGYLMTLSTNGCLTLNKGVSLDSQSTYGLQSSEVNISGSGLYVGGTQVIDSSRNVSAANVSGTITTASQPSITSVSTLDITSHNGLSQGLKLGGTLVTASATKLNYVDTTQGTAAASKALVLDASSAITGISALTATNLTGTLQTAAQPNITSVTTLDITGHDGLTVGLKLGSTLVTASATELNYVDTTQGSAQASKALVLDSNSSISGVNSFTASTIVANTPTGTDGVWISRNLSSPIVSTTAARKNALTISSYSTTVNQNVGIGFLVSTSDVSTTVPGAQIMNVRTGAGGIGDLTFSTRNSATDCVEKMRILANGNVGINTASPAYTLDVSGSTNVTSLYIGGSQITSTPSQLNTTNVTAGSATASKALVLDSSSSITGISALSATSLTGTLQTAAQTNITSLGTLTALSVSGTVSYSSTTDSLSSTTGALTVAGGVGIAKNLCVAVDTFIDGKLQLGTAGAQNMNLLKTGASCGFRVGSNEVSKNCMTMQWTYVSSGSNSNRLSFDPYGTSNALVITAAGLIGINQSAPTTPLYVSGGTASTTVGSSVTATLTSSNLLSSQTGTYLDTCAVYVPDGCIKVGARGIYISSDRRLKKDIVSIPDNEGEKFVRDVQPRKYTLKVDGATQLGYIAQELCPDFSSVVTLTENADMHSDDDPRSIEGYQLSVSYERVIPILHAALRKAFQKIDSLEQRLSQLE